MDIKTWVKSSFPRPIVTILRYLNRAYVWTHEWYLIKTQPLLHKRALIRLQKKSEPINVVFFATYSSTWKYDGLYNLFVADNRFNPVILVCPVVNRGREHMVTTLHDCYKYFNKKQYSVVCSYNESLDQYVDARSLSPDIIFYTNPYRGLIDDRYYITRFRDILTCYTPYGYAISDAPEMLFDQILHNLVFANFYETKLHKELAKQYSRNRGKNVFVTGSLLSDEIMAHKKVDRCDGKKVIIWAPHHTIENGGFSCFCIYYDLILELMDIYKERVYWVFKPHPLLKSKLYNHKDWGHDKTDLYYNHWEKTPYGEINTGDYTQLFVDSDAMIFDSISFMAEYYFSHNPSLFTVRNDMIYHKFNQFGLDVFSLLYHGDNREAIKSFVDRVLLEEDPLKNDRESFFNRVLCYPHVSNSVYKYILDLVL